MSSSDDGPDWPRRGGPWHHGSWRRRYAAEGPPRRDPEGRLLGGVAAGFARWRGWNPTTIRLAFALLTVLTSGIGIAIYVAAWLLIPAAGEDHSVWHKAKGDSLGIGLAAAAASAVVLVLLVLGAINDGWLISWLWPQVASAAGLVLIWRDASPAEQASLHRLVEPLGAGQTRPGRDRRTLLRIGLAVIMLISGLGWLLSRHASLALLSPLGGVILMLGGAVLFLAPWWLRIARDLVIERQARARAEERTEIASRVHDSVLQTLALIQRRADDPHQVIRLARSQERELRSWLFEGKDPAAEADPTFTAALARIQSDVEDRYGVPVEVVTVGDCDLDENLGALLSAAREATVNAAKWSGANVVSLYGEVEAGKVTIVVRDKGKGFDTSTVPADRKGLAESVYGRMSRHGGTASVQSAPGEGTKVTISVPAGKS
jgi:signal transduction histidine kinase